MIRRGNRARRCLAAALPIMVVAAAATWWLRRSPLQRVAPLPTGRTIVAAHGQWLVRYDEDPQSLPGGGTLDPWGRLTAAPIHGGPARRLAVPEGVPFCQVLAATDADMYLSTARAGGRGRGYSGYRIHRIPLDGGPGVVLASGANTETGPDACVAYAGSLYWFVSRSRLSMHPRRPGPAPPEDLVPDTELWTVPLQGGTPRKLLAGRGMWRRLQAGDTGLTWIDEQHTAGGPRQGPRVVRHHYRPAGDQHTVWCITAVTSASGAVERRGRYYAALTPPDPPLLCSWALDGSGRQTLCSDRDVRRAIGAGGSGHGGRGGTRQVLEHRGRLYVLLQEYGDGRSALCEVTLRSDGGRSAVRQVASLPAGSWYRAYCDSGYCYLEGRPTPHTRSGALAAWLDRYLSSATRPALYRLKLPQ